MYKRQTDANGNFVRPIDASRPIYTAGYIQDKFAFKDLIFNLGVRVDRYDANVPVLKDKYSIFDTYSAGEVGGAPSNIGSDYVVYVSDFNVEPGDATVTAYRDGDNWFSADGSSVPNPNVLGYLTPFVKDPSFISDRSKIDLNAFEDYDPQITVMPRIAFSFPISDEALFYAHYDVLAERPDSRNFNSPYRYQFWQGVVNSNNPNLEPQKTVDYEVGFKQKLSGSSAITLSTYYREIKDLIQTTNINNAFPIVSYTTYENRDFGTVKGLTLAYDLRRTNNVRLNANYTLQYADGTGSADNSAATLVALGLPEVRNVAPLNFDQRHTINASIDYRFGEGKDYDGPKWFGTDFLSNFGVNLRATTFSGRPYSKIRDPFNTLINDARNRKLIGSPNGARLPWSNRIDMRVDKDFRISNSKPLYLNLYLQVQNLLDTDNWLNVYEFTGSPVDDGFLASNQGIGEIESNGDRGQTFQDLYTINLLRPTNFTLPRTIRLGGQFSF